MGSPLPAECGRRPLPRPQERARCRQRFSKGRIRLENRMAKVLDNSTAAAATGEKAGTFTTLSGRPIRPLYRPEDVTHLDYARDLADPGQFPYTRGVHQT